MSDSIKLKVSRINTLLNDLTNIRRVSIEMLNQDTGTNAIKFFDIRGNTLLLSASSGIVSSESKFLLKKLNETVVKELESIMVKELKALHKKIGEEIDSTYVVTVQDIINKNETEKDDDENTSSNNTSSSDNVNSSIPF